MCAGLVCAQEGVCLNSGTLEGVEVFDPIWSMCDVGSAGLCGVDP